MVCFLKWGHKWIEPNDNFKRLIVDTLRQFGIYANPDKLQKCANCERVKVACCTVDNPKVRVRILPKYPEEEIENGGFRI